MVAVVVKENKYFLRESTRIARHNVTVCAQNLAYPQPGKIVQYLMSEFYNEFGQVALVM
jgi:hypothetical protein